MKTQKSEETNDQRRDREAREKEAARTKLGALLQQVVPIMSRILQQPWSVEPGTGDGWLSPHYVLRGLNDATLHAQAGDDLGRACVRGARWRGERAEFFSGTEEITVSMQRTPEAVAADIMRRVLPGYLKAREKAEALYEDHLAKQARRRGALALVAEALGQPVPELGSYEDRDSHVSWHPPYREGRPWDVPRLHAKTDTQGTVDLKLSYLPAELAANLLGQVADYIEEHLGEVVRGEPDSAPSHRGMGVQQYISI